MLGSLGAGGFYSMDSSNALGPRGLYSSMQWSVGGEYEQFLPSAGGKGKHSGSFATSSVLGRMKSKPYDSAS